MMDWLGRMLDLPDKFLFSTGTHGGGVIQGTASEATLVAMLGARNKIVTEIKQQNQNITTGEIINQLIGYYSEQAHSSVERTGLLLAINMKKLPTDHQLSLRGSTLEQEIQKDKANGLIPFYVVATLGTTNTCAFDNVIELGNVCK